MKRKCKSFIPIKSLCVGISLCCLLSNTHASAISALDARFSIQYSANQTTVKNVVDLLQKQTDIVFSYDHTLGGLVVNNISIDADNENIESILNQTFQGTGIKYKIDDQIVVLYASHSPSKTDKKEVSQQAKKVTGIVSDSSGEPVIGANVIEKGTTNGIITGIDGDFVLNVQSNAVLIVSYLGYIPQEVTVKGDGVLNIILQEDTQNLDEVVVTALGIKRQKRSIGYSTALVKGDEFTEARDPNLGNALSGKIAGVSVAGNSTGMGGSSRVIIRGNASLTGNNQPLYVIDGVPFDNSNQGSAGQWGGMDMGDGLSNINPDDIAEIQVLKGAAASALYGYRGGNGAILITTKSGSKDQKGLGIEFNNNLTFNMINDYREYQEVYGQGTQGTKPTTRESALQTYSSSWGAKMDGSEAVNFLGETYRYKMGKDNWDSFYRTGISDQTSLSVSGASEKVNYRFSVSNSVERSILPNANTNQQGINLNTTYHITPKLHTTVNANYVFENTKGRANLSDGNGNTNATLLYLANTFDVRWLRPEVDANGNELLPGNNVYFNNPYFLQHRKTNDTHKNRLTGALTLRYDVTDWLYAQGQVSRDGFNMDFRQVQPVGAAADPNGYLNEYEKSFSEINLNYLIGFDKKFADTYSVGATLGGNRQRNITQVWGTDGGIRPFLIPGFYSSSNVAADTRTYKKTYSEYQVNSVYATLDLGYKDWLFLNFTGRNDWFSTLDPNNNSFFYPSVSLSYMFSDCFEMPDWLTTGKIRASVASASNGTSPYQTSLTYTTKDFSLSGQSMGTINNSTVPNAFLKPVSITEWEIGTNAAFFNNRVGLDFAYYQKKTTDDIVQVSTSETSGFGSAIKNIGEIKNKGIELMVFAVPFSGKFTWNTSFNMAYNKSEVLYLGGQEQLTIDGAISRSGNASIRNIVGEPYGQIVGYKYKTDDNGNRIFDKDGLPIRADEVSVLGNGVYKITGGFRNDFSYKNYSLSFLLDFKCGAKLFSGTNLNLYSNGLHKNTLEGRDGGITGKGVTESGEANTAKANAEVYWQHVASQGITEEFIYNASFIKLRELSLGYTFPTSLFYKTPIRSISLSLVGRNLWTIMKHTPNIDPEAAYNNSNGQGLELNGYPATRNVGFNLNVKF